MTEPFILSIPLIPDPTHTFTMEKVWAQRLSADRARVLSVVRYGGEAQFGDIVEYKDEAFVSMVERSTLTMHRVYGGVTGCTDSMALTERLRQQGMRLEVWSLTMSNGSPLPAPLFAGLMVADPHAAVAALAGLPLYYPTLLEAIGDELGARRHLREMKKAA